VPMRVWGSLQLSKVARKRIAHLAGAFAQDE
jgi:hypothetical protein